MKSKLHPIRALTKPVMALLVITAVILSGATISVAGEYGFICHVKNEYDLADDGQLVKPKGRYYPGLSFSVERSTGKILGNPFGNIGDYQIKVLEGDFFFKVFSFAEKRKVAEYLTIMKTTQVGEQHTFVGIDYLRVVVTGICD